MLEQDSSGGLAIGGLVLAGMIALVGSACSTDQDAAENGGGVLVVATTTMLGDVARHVVGDAGVVETLIPVGVDPHDFRPSAKQAARMYAADLVVANGLGLEEGLSDVLDGAVEDGVDVVEVAPLLDPLPFGTEDGAATAHDLDPHVWLDPLRMARAADVIASELGAVDGSPTWAVNAETYAVELLATDDEIRSILEVVPAEARKLVTNHDALGYFATRYALDVVGVVIPGGSTLADPSSAELAQLVAVIEEDQVRAIFADTNDPAVLAVAVASAAGTDVTVVELYIGSLGEPGSGADSLIGMLLTNARRVAAALSAQGPSK